MSSEEYYHNKKEDCLKEMDCISGFGATFGARRVFIFQHSPLKRGEPEFRCEMLGFWGWEGFCKRVGDHVGCWAIHEAELALFDYPSDEMESYVDMFCAGVVLVFFRESDGRLVVGEHGGRGHCCAEDLRNEGAKP